jgi:DNA-binding IclR family transcriptional regulator
MPASVEQLHPAHEDEVQKTQRSVQSVEVGGRLLLALAEQPSPMALKDLAAKAGLPPSRAHPYLVSFGRLGLIAQDPVSQRYALGPAALQIGLACLHQLDPIKAATPVAEALAADIDQTVVIAVWANFGPTVVRMIEGSQPLHVNMRAGTVMSIPGTATGQAFAAAMPLWKLERAMTGALGDAGRPKRSLAGELGREVERCVEDLRLHGVTRAIGRPIPGVNAFSAPVFNHEGEAALVITALGHEDCFPAQWDSSLALAVRAAAAEVSARLGYRIPAAASTRT